MKKTLGSLTIFAFEIELKICVLRVPPPSPLQRRRFLLRKKLLAGVSPPLEGAGGRNNVENYYSNNFLKQYETYEFSFLQKLSKNQTLSHFSIDIHSVIQNSLIHLLDYDFI